MPEIDSLYGNVYEMDDMGLTYDEYIDLIHEREAADLGLSYGEFLDEYRDRDDVEELSF